MGIGRTFGSDGHQSRLIRFKIRAGHELSWILIASDGSSAHRTQKCLWYPSDVLLYLKIYVYAVTFELFKFLFEMLDGVRW